MPSNTTQSMDIASKPSPDSSSDILPAKKGVHFDLPSDDNASEHVEPVTSRPLRKRRKEPPYTPLAVFGLYMPRDLVYKIGQEYTPDWRDRDWDSFSSPERSLLRNEGVLFASSYCKAKFPDIPLRWNRTIMAYAGDPMELHPILVLGHMDSHKNVIIDVTREDMEQMQEELGLGDQEPYWYNILYFR